MNASVRLLEQTLPGTVHLQVSVPDSHPSVPVLGTERAGTGAIVDDDGLIVTVNYVVLGAKQATITTLEGQERAAEVVAQDFATGVAVLWAAGSDWEALPLRPTDDVAVGEDVFIAASVGDAGRRAASGGVTAISPFEANWEYSLDPAIFTSAMNPGLGGGPLVDVQGRVLGIISLNLNEIGRFSLGIPIACFRDHRDELLRFGRRQSRASRAWLGLFCYTLRDHVVVAGLVPGAPGEIAGLAQGDVILGIDRQRIATRREFYEYLWSRPAGSSVTLEFYREDEIRTLEVSSVDVEEFFRVMRARMRIGVTHLFGIPGDLVINLFFKFGRRRGLKIVTLSHEPGIGFAADGYARATGRLGVLCVTYGAGGHNMVNPVAGSFSERVPILVVSGGPGEEERKLGQLIHHQAKEIESQLRIYQELTCAARVLQDPRTVAETVHEVVQTMWREQRSGYLEIHRDMVETSIEVPDDIRRWDGKLEFAHSDERKTIEASGRKANVGPARRTHGAGS